MHFLILTVVAIQIGVIPDSDWRSIRILVSAGVIGQCVVPELASTLAKSGAKKYALEYRWLGSGYKGRAVLSGLSPRASSEAQKRGREGFGCPRTTVLFSLVQRWPACSVINE